MRGSRLYSARHEFARKGDGKENKEDDGATGKAKVPQCDDGQLKRQTVSLVAARLPMGIVYH